MNDVFDAYAAYYDLLYADKNYSAESDWIAAQIRSIRPDARTVLELGCGTGGHALHLAKRGYSILGVDFSESMIARATANARSAHEVLGSLTPDFVTGDLRTFRSSRSFDVVVSLFHVISYQTTNKDLRAAMATAASHLVPGGLFIFDCWYGPGVLSDPPETRVRRLQGDGFAVTRIAEPQHFPDENRVDVHYEILVNQGNETQQIRERHPMRYLFTPEVDLLLSEAGLSLLSAKKWMGDATPGLSDWNACYIATR